MIRKIILMSCISMAIVTMRAEENDSVLIMPEDNVVFCDDVINVDEGVLPELLQPRLVNLNEPVTLDMQSETKKAVSECYYNFNRDFSWTPIPIIAAGYIAKSQKKNFREARQKFEPNFEHHLDDWLQHGPLALTFGLKFAGVEGRSDWKRYLVSGILSYATMGAIVNGIKYSAKEMRPDGSTANSFPSGHTATAFVAATILHKEYGLTRSPWYSVGAYAAATTTGVMRSLNNRHWISDIMVGAGIGVLSTDLGYFFGDLIFKDKHIIRQELEDLSDFYDHPSFFSVQMGATFAPNIDLPELPEWNIMMDQGYPKDFSGQTPTDDGKLRIGTATTVAAEGAYFFNPYIGVGGRLKVSTAPVRANGMNCYDINDNMVSRPGDITDQLAMFSIDGGMYFQLPLSRRFALGTKATFGGLFSSSLELSAVEQQEIDFSGWGDYLYVESIKTTKYGTGLSLTYAAKSNISWKLNLDYDYCHVPFNLVYQPDFKHDKNLSYRIFQTKIKQNMHMFTLGGSITIRF
ncbi:MAG: phosphatase PAP2 family protein [Bacteroidaceae bacterium]|nr:phosphatase PAP2 family protein [Bacteroidaceae bacterium]